MRPFFDYFPNKSWTQANTDHNSKYMFHLRGGEVGGIKESGFFFPITPRPSQADQQLFTISPSFAFTIK